MQLASWIDDYGNRVRPGDLIEFSTLYGQRQARVLRIHLDPDPMCRRHEQDYAAPLTPEVYFDILPLQVGPADAFKPLRQVQSWRWSVHSYRGPQTHRQFKSAFRQFVKRLQAWSRSRYRVFSGAGI